MNERPSNEEAFFSFFSLCHWHSECTTTITLYAPTTTASAIFLTICRVASCHHARRSARGPVLCLLKRKLTCEAAFNGTSWRGYRWNKWGKGRCMQLVLGWRSGVRVWGRCYPRNILHNGTYVNFCTETLLLDQSWNNVYLRWTYLFGMWDCAGLEHSVVQLPAQAFVSLAQNIH